MYLLDAINTVTDSVSTFIILWKVSSQIVNIWLNICSEHLASNIFCSSLLSGCIYFFYTFLCFCNISWHISLFRKTTPFKTPNSNIPLFYYSFLYFCSFPSRHLPLHPLFDLMKPFILFILFYRLTSHFGKMVSRSIWSLKPVTWEQS